MAARLQSWFARQSLTVKLLLAIPVLLAALFWSALPSGDTRRPDPGNKPVLSTSNTTTNNGGQAAAAGTAQASPAADQPLLPHQEPQPADTGLSWGTALRTLVSVAVVIVLILLSAQGLKYVMAGAAQPLRGTSTIRVVETLHLPSPTGRGRSAIHLIEVGEQMLLVGATDTQLTLLTELPDDEATARLRRSASQSASAGGGAAADTSFAQTLATADGTDAKPSTSSRTANGSLSGRPVGANRASTAANGRGRHEARPGAAGEAELAQLLQRLRESKQRFEAED